MSWSAIVSAIVGVVGLIRDFFAWKKDTDARQAGRDSANADTLRANAERVSEARRAEADADNAHLSGDDAFDLEFRRD